MAGGAEYPHACYDDAACYADIYQDIRHIRSREGCERGHRYGCNGNIALDRLVAKLVINSTDVFPDDCTTITLDFREYNTLSWATMDVTDAVDNQRIVDVTSQRGATGTVLSYFVLAPKDGYQTDITLTTNRTEGNPYSIITVPGVMLERNKVTTITGPIYGHGQGFQVTVNDAWDSEGHDINI